jgi:serine/threonine protein kinase
MLVEVKTRAGIFASESDIQNVSAEILKMQKFDHPNVMPLIGVCVGPSSNDSGASGPCIVMPFMAKGSLLDRLRKEADNLFVKNEDDDNVRNS